MCKCLNDDNDDDDGNDDRTQIQSTLMKRINS